MTCTMNANPRTLASDFIRFRDYISSLPGVKEGLGLEVGPFDRPFFSKSESNVRFLDYKSTSDLRSTADMIIGHDGNFVEEVDYLVPGSGLWDIVPNETFDWILSSHALEHSPNLIGFLRTINRKLKQGGLVVSLLPDKRRTYDSLKPPTTLGRVFEDYFTSRKLSSFQATFDGQYYTRHAPISAAEDQHLRSASHIPEGVPVQVCIDRGLNALNTYLDEHNYIFTSMTFETISREICSSGLIGMALVDHHHTRDGEMTFINIMKKVGAPAGEDLP